MPIRKLATKLRFVRAAALACLGLHLAMYPGVHAADYPNKTVRVIVPYAPGGGVDIDMAHIPYKGSGPSVNALLAGEIQVIFSSATSILPHIKSGRVRALAVTGPRRTPIAPDVPTVAEAGLPCFEVISWYGLLAPARTPTVIINRLNAQVKALKSFAVEGDSDHDSITYLGNILDFFQPPQQLQSGLRLLRTECLPS